MDSTTGEPTEMADTLHDIQRTLATVVTKLDLLAQRWDPVLADHEARIRKLEQKVWVASGAALAGGGTLGAVIAHLTGS